MPAPTNISAATAVELGPLPNSISQRVDDAGTTYVVWYKYTPPSDQIIGLWAFGDLTVYTPEVEMFQADGVTPYVPVVGGSAAVNKRLQIPVASGAVVYFKISEVPLATNPSPANLTISALVAPNDAIVAGDLLINDDHAGMPGCVVTPTGAIRRFVLGMANGEGGAILPAGQYVLSCGDQNTGSGEVKIYNADSSFRTAVVIDSPGGGLEQSIVGASNTYFYALDDDDESVKQFTLDGTILNSWTPTSLQAQLAPSRDDTILYYVGPFPGTVIKRWDLVNNLALSDLYTFAANTRFVPELLVLSDGTIITGAHNTSSGAYQVLHLSAAGAVLHTLTVTSSGTLNRLALNVGDTATSIWAWSLTGTSNAFSLFQELRLSDGGVLQSTGNVLQYETGAYNLPATATPTTEFGPSFSCPFLVLRAASSLPGSIIVTKTTPGLSGITTTFPFGATGGLSPASFSLTPTTSQTFSSVPAGSGYGISETAPDGWTVAYTVSNGSPVNNLTVGSGETVTVTAANTVTHTGTVDPVRRLRQTAHLSDEQVWLFFSKFQLDVQAGGGLNDGQGADPQVMLSWSDDGGHTWSAEHWVSAGKQGEYRRRAIWRRLGRSRDRVWRIVVSDPVAWRILAAYVDVTKGTS